MLPETILLFAGLAGPPSLPDVTIDLRPVPLRDGIRDSLTSGDPSRLAETPLYETAKRAGVDLAAEPPHPLFLVHYEKGRLFHLFYKSVENAFGDRPYLIQRIRKTERAWSAPDAEPETKVTYLVEVFKTIGGELKRPDQHFGSFGLGDLHRREIVKEYEIGFGEIPGKCEGTAWPYPADSLFRQVQDYAPEKEVFDAVRFSHSLTWSLSVAFDSEGRHSVRVPEFGLDAPTALPHPSVARPRPNPESEGVVLDPGAGAAGLAVGETTAEQATQRLGEPLEDVRFKAGNRNLCFANGLTVNFSPDGRVNTVFTRSGFLGRCARGVHHGASRRRVRGLYGASGEPDDAATWTYPGVHFRFDASGRVDRILVLASRE